MTGSLVRLTLRTLGGAGLYAVDRQDVLLGPGKPLALLVYLALTPGRRTSREFLMELLWADLTPERARSALRQALFHLRRLLGEDALPGSEELTLAQPIDSDRDRFLAAIEQGSLEEALEVYTGEFLPAFGVPGGAAFEQWGDLERGRLRAAFLRSAELVVRRRLNQSRFREAQRLARRVRDEVPHSEGAWRLLLETVVAARDFVAAAVEAGALEQWAAAEGIALEPATRLAIARARQVTPAGSETREDFTLVAELTGREREFSAIIAAWEAARGGGARHLHLSAPAGLGKTRLLQDAVARLTAAGATVVQVRGAPGDRDIPYTTAGDLAAALAMLPGAAGIAPASAATLLALNPALSSRHSGTPDPATGEDALRRRVQALTDLVQAVAHEQPFVLAIDDLHWSDAVSLQVLEGVFGRLGAAHVLCLTAARPERALPGAATLVPLAPLTAAQVAALVSALGAVPDHAPWGMELAGGLHEATRGSPLLVLQTLRLALDEAMLTLEAGEWGCPDPARLASLLRAGEPLRQRIRALPAEQGWVLALLATVSTPLTLESLAATPHLGPGDPAESLGALERLGLVTRTGAGWLPAHDEIGASARAALDAEGRAEAARVAAAVLFGSAGTDPHRFLRGVRHLVAAGDELRLRREFRRYARLLRGTGDRRPFGVLAAEFLGEDLTAARARDLLSDVPRRWRLGLWSPARERWAAGILLLLGAGLAAGAKVRDARDAGLQRIFFGDRAGRISQLAVQPGEWDGRNTPALPARGRSSLPPAAVSSRDFVPIVSPDGKSAAWTQDSGDSTTLDIWIRTPAGTRRLTRQLRDDVVSSWTPDGSALVGMTNRWTSPENGNYDIAVFDTATGGARQISSGSNHDGAPFVSPDGTRIAFIRESDVEGPRICVVPFDGGDPPECRFAGGAPVAELLGWSGMVELVAILDSAGTRPLIRYDWQRNEANPLLGPHVYRGRLSPDRRWVVAAVRLEGIPGFRDWIIPVDRPAQARRVEGQGATATVRWWEGPADRSAVIDRIELTDTTRSILLGVSTRFSARALTAAGNEVPLPAPVRWRSSDTLVATVDGRGDVRPRSAGTVSIEASLAGWRHTVRSFRVTGTPARVVLEEPWNEGWTARWIVFGEPRPQVVTGPEHLRAFWNHGDGTYQSTAILRQGLSATQGLGVELRLSTPLGSSGWQRTRTMFVTGVDTAAFQGADQRKAPPSLGRTGADCGVTYPTGSGAFGRDQIMGHGAISQAIPLKELAGKLVSGKWWLLRIQILPDGRCGIAVDGKVLWVSPEALPLDGEFRLRLGDESAGSQLLHGPLIIWTGVRTDLDWSGRDARPN